jgi:hypothetical protein
MAKNKQRRSRNPVAHHLFINRGGVHEKSNSAKRQEDKRQLRKLVVKTGAGFSGPDFFGGFHWVGAVFARQFFNCALF